MALRTSILLLAAFAVAGCARFPKTAPTFTSPVRHVSTANLPGLAPLAEEAIRVANADYARIRELLHCSPKCGPARFSIQFKDRLWIPYQGPGAGFTGRKVFQLTYSTKRREWTFLRIHLPRRVIQLSAEWMRRSPDTLARILRHEMTHLVQDYAPGAPEYWREGIADFVAYTLSNQADCPECDAPSPHYDAGYRCAAAFLFFLHENYTTETVPRLHQSLVAGMYSESFFAELTGKPLAELWAEFQQTSRFTSDARMGLQIREAAKQPEGAATNAPALFHAFLLSREGGTLTAEALEYLRDRIEAGELPGPASLRPAKVVLGKGELDQPAALPARRTLHLLSADREDRYDYTLTKESEAAEWKIESTARLNNRTGEIIQQYSLPRTGQPPRRGGSGTEPGANPGKGI